MGISSEQLSDYRAALPIIMGLQENGANELIQVLDSADEHALIAFARLTEGSDLSALVEMFLVKNSKELERIDRNHLIQFLRQPDLALWLTKYLEPFITNLVQTMSFFDITSKELDKIIAELNDFELDEFKTSKYRMLERKLIKAIVEAGFEISSQKLTNVLSERGNDTLFFLLGSAKYRTNALNIFYSILSEDKTRKLLFSGLFESDFQQFLEQNNAALCLANYMANYHDKPWFSQCLPHFAFYAKKYKKENLLSDALAILSQAAHKNLNNALLFDAVLESLVGTEEVAGNVMNCFLNSQIMLNGQDTGSTAIQNVTQYFGKQHVIEAIKKLNKISYWEKRNQYQLIVHIVNNQFTQFFQPNEIDLLPKQKWQTSELKELSRFIIRHLSKKRSGDKNATIGHMVLGELIFRSANSGLISLFYHKGIFNPRIARLSFTQPFLESLVDKLWVPEVIKKHYSDPATRIKAWLENSSFIKNQLNEHHVLKDWRDLINQTWKEKKKLPILCVYLLNYTGQKESLLKLLSHYFKHFQKEKEYLYPVCHLLRQFPGREVSAVIFDALEEAAIKNPQILDEVVLQDMAYYFSNKIMNQNLKSPQSVIDLLVYFGQNKRYMLVQQGCEQFAKNCDDEELKKRLIKGANEARIEGSLIAYVDSLYFGLIKIMKRLWHFGLGSNSKFVKFCDDNSPGPVRSYAGDTVNTSILCQRELSPLIEFKEKRNQLISLLETIQQCSLKDTVSKRPSFTPQWLFNNSPTVTLIAKECVTHQVSVVN